MWFRFKDNDKLLTIFFYDKVFREQINKIMKQLFFK